MVVCTIVVGFNTFENVKIPNSYSFFLQLIGVRMNFRSIKKLGAFFVVFLSCQALGVFANTEIPECSSPSPSFQSSIPYEFTLDDNQTLTPLLNRKFGGHWNVLINPVTGTSHLAWLSRPEGRTVSSLDEWNIEHESRKIIEDLPEVFGISEKNLRKVYYAQVGSKISIIFQQYYNGAAIRSGLVRLIFSDTGGLVALGSDVFPQIQLPTLSVSENQAIELTINKFGPSELTNDQSATLSWLPEYSEDGIVSFLPLWNVECQLKDEYSSIGSLVNGNTGEIIEKWFDEKTKPLSEPVKSGTTISGQVTSRICAAQGPYWSQPNEIHPLALIKVRCGVNEVYTDEDGYYTIDFDGAANSVEVEFYGELGRVYTQGLNNNESPIVSRNIDPLNPPPVFDIFIETEFAPIDVDINVANVYYHMTDLRIKLQNLVPSFTSWNELQRVNGIVSPNGSENYGGRTSISLGQKGGLYQGPLVASIIFHELSHSFYGFISYHYGVSTPTAQEEGVGDALGMIYSGDRKFGRGYSVNWENGGIRLYNWWEDAFSSEIFPDCEANRCPENWAPNVHTVGRVIGSFYMDICELMINPNDTTEDDWNNGTIYSAAADLTAQMWLESYSLMFPTSMQDHVLAAFLNDDDDSDLSTLSPNQEALCLAASQRNYLHMSELTNCIPHPTISEVMVDPVEVDDSMGEFIEVSNSGFNAIDLDGWVLAVTDTSSNVTTHTISRESGLFLDHQHIVFARDCSEINARWPGTFECYQYGTDLLLPNSGGMVELINPETGLSEGRVQWQEGTNWPYVPGQSMQWVGNGENSLNPDLWVNFGPENAGKDRGTPGLESSATIGLDQNPTILKPGFCDVQILWSTEIPAFCQFKYRIVGDPGWITYSTGPSFDHSVIAHIEPNHMFEFQILATHPGVVSENTSGTFKQKYCAREVNSDLITESTYLSNAYPNPFNPQTEISFGLAGDEHVNFEILNIRGERVRTLVNSRMSAGKHNLVWNGCNDDGAPVPSGVYFLRLKAGSFSQIKKTMLLK